MQCYSTINVDHMLIIHKVRRTQKAIKHVLTERWYAWDSARNIAMKDPTVDLTGDGPAYSPYETYEEKRGP